MTSSFEYAGHDLESMDFADKYHRLILELFAPYLGNRVAEVGAGSGSFAALLATEPISSLVAIEPSAAMYKRLRAEAEGIRNVDIEIYNGFLADCAKRLKPNPPDSFVYINVFEHIEDDVAEMRRAFDLLPAGGHLCIFVPAIPGLYSEFDKSIDHFRRYTKAELEEKVGQAGFSVEYARYFDWLGVAPWWLRFKLLKAKRMSAGAVRLYDTVGVPIIKLTEAIAPPPFGKNVILIARKP